MRHRQFSTTERYYLKDDAAAQAGRLAAYLTRQPVDKVYPKKQGTVAAAAQ